MSSIAVNGEISVDASAVPHFGIGGPTAVAQSRGARERQTRGDASSMVEIRRMVGNEENSSGAWMNSAVIRIRIDSVIEIARKRSSTIEGRGRISTTRMVRTPSASAMSPRFKMVPISLRFGNPLGAAVP